MTPQDQEFISIPGKQYGDCMRACVASLLNMNIALVPHFLRDADGKSVEFWEGIYDFLDSRGYEMIPSIVAYRPKMTADLDGYHIVSGPSPRGNGLYHAVVGRHGDVVFDPHPSRAGLAGDRKEWRFDYMVKK